MIRKVRPSPVEDIFRLQFFPIIYFHELIHYVTARLVGLDAEIDMWTYNSAATLVEGDCSRTEGIAVLVAPFGVCSTLALVVILGTPEGHVLEWVGVAFFIGAIGSGMDLTMARDIYHDDEFEGFDAPSDE